MNAAGVCDRKRMTDIGHRPASFDRESFGLNRSRSSEHDIPSASWTNDIIVSGAIPARKSGHMVAFRPEGTCFLDGESLLDRGSHISSSSPHFKVVDHTLSLI
jgi:hypothetical protein